MRVLLPLSKPLDSGIWVNRKGKEPLWVNFKYERLPHFCFSCGRLDHETKLCKKDSRSLRVSFGAWLRIEVEDITPVQVQMAYRGKCNGTNTYTDVGGSSKAIGSFGGVTFFSQVESGRSSGKIVENRKKLSSSLD